MTIAGLWFWQPMSGPDWGWMALLCLTGAAGHYTLIKCYEVAEAGAVQPFAYFQMVFASGVGIMVFGETLAPNVAARRGDYRGGGPLHPMARAYQESRLILCAGNYRACATFLAITCVGIG